MPKSYNPPSFIQEFNFVDPTSEQTDVFIENFNLLSESEKTQNLIWIMDLPYSLTPETKDNVRHDPVEGANLHNINIIKVLKTFKKELRCLETYEKQIEKKTAFIRKPNANGRKRSKFRFAHLFHMNDINSEV